MINIVNKSDCCGCNACVLKCPKHCIQMFTDNEGFSYPQVNATICIDCGLCEKVCPVLNTKDPKRPIAVEACVNTNENIRIDSSSGGFFYELAKTVVGDGGIVFGVEFNDKWEVRHGYTNTELGIKKFQGSKYVQSIIGENYKNVEVCLKSGAFVLFTGTACQIAGLYGYLRKTYENLLTVDVLCHGVPSPLIWKNYLSEICTKNNQILSDIKSIYFRNKRNGWKRFGLEIVFRNDVVMYEPLDENIYLQGFLNDLYLRPSCYSCRFRGGRCHSDLTIADYWGIWEDYPDLDDDKGTSLVLINTQRGEDIFKKLKIKYVETNYEYALRSNSPLEHSVQETVFRKLFWDQYKVKGLNAISLVCKKKKPGFLKKYFDKIMNRIK